MLTASPWYHFICFPDFYVSCKLVDLEAWWDSGSSSIFWQEYLLGCIVNFHWEQSNVWLSLSVMIAATNDVYLGLGIHYKVVMFYLSLFFHLSTRILLRKETSSFQLFGYIQVHSGTASWLQRKLIRFGVFFLTIIMNSWI